MITSLDVYRVNILTETTESVLAPGSTHSSRVGSLPAPLNFDKEPTVIVRRFEYKYASSALVWSALAACDDDKYDGVVDIC